MEKRRRKVSSEIKYWKLLEKYLGKYKNDFAHGLPHIERVYRIFDLFQKNKAMFEKSIIEALRCAVILHDIGRPKKNHAHESAEILKKLFKKDFKSTKNQDWIIYAVDNHSSYLPKPKKIKNEYKCYALLTFFDLMDTIGKIGPLRDLMNPEDKNTPFLPKDKNYLKEIKKQIDHPKIMDEKSKNKMKKNSILGHTAVNYNVMVKEVTPRVNTLLNSDLKKEKRKRLKFIRDFFAINQSRPY